MAVKAFSFKSLLSFTSRVLHKRLKNTRSLQRKLSTNAHLSPFKLKRYSSSLTQRSSSSSSLDNLSKHSTSIFNVESALLKSTSLFPYFMIVAFEAGGLLRALILLLLYPFVCLMNKELGMKVMVFVCFCGIKRQSFRVGRAVLPKFFLEDVGFEGLDVVRRGGRKVGVSDLPRVMVEGFLREYLDIDVVVGRELKEFHGYYLGLMEDKKKGYCSALENVIGHDDERTSSDGVVGFGSLDNLLDHQFFSLCKDMYIVTEADKRSWTYLSKEKYPKPLIFHDGRLAIRPTPITTVAIFMWVPLGLFLAITRALIGTLLPYKLSTPLLALSGIKLRLITLPKPSLNVSTNETKQKKGVLYVCNHRTLMDPLYLSTILNKPVTAVTYSLSKVSELLAPIKTVSLTRDKQKDSRILEKLLSQGDLVMCPEGTTCRENFLLRFSPLFAEMGDEIIPVAMDSHVNMFYGTTASGLKCLDPVFFLMNPCPSYTVKLLDKVNGVSACGDDNELRLKVANHVQEEIGKALGFQCTRLTRKDKYLVLADNEGIVKL
ncbi:hypothetical protein Sjap_006993 [Stephania japonica]|uniref:Phospholipid/glycerol acyltransferase domain-containing protein n=1 Tax=Stephania japonica TaxID=461633 RepID=A0AAP0K9I8_9MAGN